MKKILSYLKKPIVFIPLIIVLLLVLIVYRRAHSAKPAFESAVATVGDVKETVSVTGTISPVGKADLAFEKSGVVSRIYVAVGDNVSRGDPIASLDSANDAAALASAQATLADTSRSLTPTELAVAQTSVANAQSDALNADHDGFAKAQSAVVNNADAFFTNPQSANPTINIQTPSDQSKIAINNERLSVSDALSAWSLELSKATASSSGSDISDALSHISIIKTFMSNLSLIVNALNPGNSGLSQSAIDSAVANINSGLTAVNAASDAVTSAQTELRTAQSNYNLKVAGNSPESISAQSARVAGAQAVLAQDTVRAPINGVVTMVTPNVGEFVSAGQTNFGVQSNNEYKIEAFVPEADIAKVAVGDTGTTTLDAYGSNTFFGVTVTAIDPAETVIEGVPTYKVTLLFTQPDTRIRSGMTANLDILTHERDAVLEIPYRAITMTATSTTVRLVNSDGKTFTAVPVTTGLKGSDGTIEILSGIKAGDTVVTYISS